MLKFPATDYSLWSKERRIIFTLANLLCGRSEFPAVASDPPVPASTASEKLRQLTTKFGRFVVIAMNSKPGPATRNQRNGDDDDHNTTDAAQVSIETNANCQFRFALAFATLLIDRSFLISDTVTYGGVDLTIRSVLPADEWTDELDDEHDDEVALNLMPALRRSRTVLRLELQNQEQRTEQCEPEDIKWVELVLASLQPTEFTALNRIKEKIPQVPVKSRFSSEAPDKSYLKYIREHPGFDPKKEVVPAIRGLPNFNVDPLNEDEVVIVDDNAPQPGTHVLGALLGKGETCRVYSCVTTQNRSEDINVNDYKSYAGAFVAKIYCSTAAAEHEKSMYERVATHKIPNTTTMVGHDIRRRIIVVKPEGVHFRLLDDDDDDENHKKLAPNKISATHVKCLIDAVQALHRAGIVHCDIQPPNLFCVASDPDNKAILNDFGRAGFRETITFADFRALVENDHRCLASAVRKLKGGVKAWEAAMLLMPETTMKRAKDYEIETDTELS